MHINKFILALLLSLAIAGCSGGGGYGSSYSSSTTPAGTYLISGTVTLTGNPLLGAMISLTGTRSTSTTTDSYGYYSFTGLSNGSYTVTPSGLGYTYTPASAVVNISGASVTGKNFAGS